MARWAEQMAVGTIMGCFRAHWRAGAGRRDLSRHALEHGSEPVNVNRHDVGRRGTQSKRPKG